MPTRRTFFQQGLAASALFLYPSGFALAMPKGRSAVETRNEALLPDAYFRRLAKWCPVIAKRLKDEPLPLKQLEATKGWNHLPYNVLSAAVLYVKANPANPFYRKPEMRKLACDLGDLMVREDRAGTFAPRLDSYRDTYMWLEAYQLLKDELGAERKSLWEQSLRRNVSLLIPDIMLSRDAAQYTENFIASSPNHLAWWAATVLVAGIYLNDRSWIVLGGGVLKRFAATEQNPDGYWGEHNPNAPTGGYNYLSAMAVGVFWEHTKDEDALKALRRATTFHANFTYPDGNLMELFNDRNRYWHISAWGQFAFSHFPDGRGYCKLLMDHMDDNEIDLDALGLLAMNALYYHDGPVTLPPPSQTSYKHRLTAEAGARKTGPWVTALSGIIDTPLPRSQWFLDRQVNLSLFHEKTGLIVNGGYSKHQPELATFRESLGNQEWNAQPKGSLLSQGESEDALALAFNSFSTEIQLPAPTEDEAIVRVDISGRGPAQEAFLTLQLCLQEGQTLTTGAERTLTVDATHIKLNAAEMNGSIRHNGWTLKLKDEASLEWPVYPYNPYRNGPETLLKHAVALLRIPLKLQSPKEHWMQPHERMIELRFQVNPRA